MYSRALHPAVSAALVVLSMVIAQGPAEGQSTWFSGWVGKITMVNAPGSSWDTLVCPRGFFAVGLTVRSGIYVDALALECAKVGRSGQHLEYRRTKFHGGNQGTLRTLRCPSGEVLYGFRGRAGELIDRMQAACRSWTAGTGTHGSVRWLSAVGGTGGSSYGPVTCPGNMGVVLTDVLIKGFLLSGPFVANYSFSCQAPS